MSQTTSANQSKKHTKVLIIGSGPAGYTAAIYATRANLSPLQVLGLQQGGQLMITTDVENYPGFSKVIQGPWLMEEMKAQAKNVGTEMLEDQVISLNLKERPFRATTEWNGEITADAVILATGAQAKWLGLPSETFFRGYGVSGCATCDGFFFKGKKVAIVGGGNTAVEEALFLTNHAAEVILVHRRDELRAEKMLQDRFFRNSKIRTIWDHEIDEILGTSSPKSVTAIKIRNVKTKDVCTIAVDGVFIAIGHSPSTQLVKGQINLDGEGYVVTQEGLTKTELPGFFAAGDVQDKIFRQAVTAAGQGCMAALEAERYLGDL